MKTLLPITIGLGLIALALFTGCSVLGPAVPTTKLKAEVAGQSFSISNPKNTTVTGIVCEVATNGTARLSITALSSTNDVQVVDKSYAGQAAVIHEVGIIQHQAAQDVISGLGTAAGAAAKAP